MLDDWNGSGTTSSVATSLGFNAYGFDLNPAMVVVAKARLLSKREYSSIEPLALEVIAKAHADKAKVLTDDPLEQWFGKKSSHDLRKLERAVRHLLVDHEKYELPINDGDLNSLSGICAFLYLALFRTVRALLQRFMSSNPTWVRTPQHSKWRLKPQARTVCGVFLNEALAMVAAASSDQLDPPDESQAVITVARSEALPLKERSVDFALASPPYCTRIDYAVATKPELAMLGYGMKEFRDLRTQLLGTSTVPRVAPMERKDFGPKCLKFLSQLKHHRSRASGTYYYKNHLQYFDGLFLSVRELRRVLKGSGACALVVQDSYYKEIKNDLPGILTEMALANGLELVRREDFVHDRTMAAVNPASRHYRRTFTATESVLIFAGVHRDQGLESCDYS